MKKRIVLGLVLIASLSMLLSSFARADETLQTSAQAELLKQNERDLSDVRALLKDANDDESRDLIQARIWDLQQERAQLSTQLD